MSSTVLPDRSFEPLPLDVLLLLDLLQPAVAARSVAATATARYALRRYMSPPHKGSVALLGTAAQLVQVDGEDQDDAHGHALPVGLHAEDDQTAVEYRRNEHPDHGAHHGTAPAEQAGAAEHHGGDDVEVVGAVPRDRGGVEER